MNIIVIPIYKNWHLCHSLLNSLRKFEKDNIDQVYVVNDFSKDAEVDGGLDFWVSSGLIHVQVIENEENLGFTLSANKGLKTASKDFSDSDVIHLISSDVKIGGRFIERVSQVAESQKALVGQKLLYGDTGWNTFDGKIFPYLEGWFLSCTVGGWKDLGYFDDAYAPYDYEDIDLSTMAASKGYKTIPMNLPTVTHAGGGTIGYTDERRAITERNREYFRRKWMNE